MRFSRKGGKERKARQTAYRKEAWEHKWVALLLALFWGLLTVYYAFSGALSTEAYLGLSLLLLGAGLIDDFLHKRNLRDLKLVVVVFCASLLAGLLVGAASQATQPAYAYTNSGGTVTSSNGKVTVNVPYVVPPSTSFAASLIPCIGLVDGSAASPCSSSSLGTTLTVTWFEDEIANLLIGAVNIVIYVANVIVGAIVDVVGAIVTLPVYLFDTVSVTTLGPVVDFLALFPATYGWIATAVVWSIALTEWIIILLVLVRLVRVAIGSTAGIFESEEDSAEGELGALS